MFYRLFVAERLAIIRQQRAEAAKKREEEKAGIFPFIYNILSQPKKCTIQQSNF